MARIKLAWPIAENFGADIVYFGNHGSYEGFSG